MYPVRLVTVAWGDDYVNLLCDVTLPTLLSPDNIPALADGRECELVIVTTSEQVARIRQHPTYDRFWWHCPISFRVIDDLLGTPESYGMTLTLALHRGFAELGQGMTDTNLVFFNADWVFADGSLATLAERFANDQRLIIAPTYCVRSESVIPALVNRSKDGAISISKREMAALALANLHNTILGKMANRRQFSMRWIDQFYWMIDATTLVCHQIPPALVAMRPTLVVERMQTFWDYGIVSAACSGAEPYALRDSDEFLMIELRKSDVFRNEISIGWPSRWEVAQRMGHFVTGDSLSMAHHRFVLHSENLPEDTERVAVGLDSYVERTLAYLPDNIVDQVSHPGWVYHEHRRAQPKQV